MLDRIRPYAGYLICAAVTATAIATRPLLPVDETRYLTVAWEMWLNADPLLPTLNGLPYSHKPPLLFWLINLAWNLFGVSELVARIIPTLFALATLWAVGRIARRLWPELPAAEDWARIALASTSAFALYSTLVMFDAALSFATALAILALVEARRSEGIIWWVAFGGALGIGALAKGPVILLHVLPAALLAPLWSPRRDGEAFSWRRWYAMVGLGVVIGFWIALAWALPAALAGGEQFGIALFWRQSAGRIVDSFAHRHPWWFFLAALPLLVYPWGLLPRLWQAMRRHAASDRNGGLPLAAIWCIAALGGFSAISGKQLHYLLPELPAFALAAGFAIASGGVLVSRRALILPVLPLIVISAVAMLAPLGIAVAGVPSAIAGIGFAWEPFTGWALAPVLVLAIAVLVLPRKPVQHGLALASLTAGALVAVHVVAAPILAARYDLSPTARYLAAHENPGIATVCGYHGEFGFLGRLTHPVVELPRDAAGAWLDTHPGGLVVDCPVRLGGPPETLAWIQLYRGRWLVAVSEHTTARLPSSDRLPAR